MKIELESVSVSYDGVEALKDVTFSYEGPGMVAVVGPNGSGKTTLLRSLNRKLSPAGGRILIDGRDVETLTRREIARLIGVVPQMSGIGFPFPVADVVLMGRTPHIKGFAGERKEDYAAASRAMVSTGTEHLADRPITEISGGEYQRVVIARALAQEPSILLLDEPTLHLDLKHQLELLDLLQGLVRDKGLTVLLTTHDINLALRYPDRAMLLDSGRILIYGKPQEVLTKEHIRSAYGVEVEFVRSGDSGVTCIIPISASPEEKGRRPP